MRRGFFNVMARVMSVRNAARIHKLDLDPRARSSVGNRRSRR
jgi:hypothetical protein